MDAAAGVVWEAAVITVIGAAEGSVLAETNATGVVHNAAVVAFDEVKAAIGDAKYGVTSTVIGIITVVVICSVIVEGGWCVC